MSEPTAEKTNLSNTRITDKEELEEIVVLAGVHDEGGVLAVVKGGGETVMESQRMRCSVSGARPLRRRPRVALVWSSSSLPMRDSHP